MDPVFSTVLFFSFFLPFYDMLQHEYFKFKCFVHFYQAVGITEMDTVILQHDRQSLM
jgi:hypothetical protein